MIASLSPPALRSFIGSLNQDQYNELWRQLVEEADRVPPLDPREALRWHVEKERQQRFNAWFAKLDLVAKSRAYLQVVAGTDLDAIMAGGTSNGKS